MRFLILLLSAWAVTAATPALIGPGTSGQRTVGFYASLPTPVTNPTNPIPSTNLVDWPLLTGVEGGIPARTTYISLSSTVTLAQVNAHLAACPSNQQISLAAGTYDWTGGALVLKDGVSFIGSGSNTFIKLSQKIYATKEFGSLAGQLGTNFIASGYSLGSSNLTLSGSVSFIVPGCLLTISELNDTNYVHSYGYEINATAPKPAGSPPWMKADGASARSRGQVVRVVSVSGQDVVIWPPISGIGYTAGLEPMVHYQKALDPGPINNLAWVGFRDLTLTNSGLGILDFEGAQNSWVSNVVFHISAADSPSLYAKFAIRFTVQNCKFYGYVGSASAIVVGYDTSGFRIENNKFERCNQSVLFSGLGGFHAVLYNWSRSTNGTTALIAEMSGHGAHQMFILWEGNDFEKAQPDSVHGSASHWLFVRNRARGGPTWITSGRAAFAVDSWQYYMTFVGNEMGPNPGTGWTWESISPAAADSAPYWRIGYSGYNPYDTGTNTLATMIRHGNTEWVSGTPNTHWDPAITSQTIPTSVFYTSQPDYLSGKSWPVFGPGTAFDSTLPAQAL